MFKLSDEKVKQFNEDGYFILESVLDNEMITMMQGIADDVVERTNKKGLEKGNLNNDITHINKRYFYDKAMTEYPKIGEIIFSDMMADITQKTLGDDVYLFTEQFVIKSAEKGMKFDWHQDSGYIPYEHKPYITCWFAFDDMCIENGTVYVLPKSTSEITEKQEHKIIDDSNDLVGYFGEESGIPAIVPAGSLVVFSSLTLHRSGSNSTDKPRRAWIAQYSTEKIIDPDGTLRNMAEPFIIDGKNVKKALV